MAFEAAAHNDYDRFMGRYSAVLAPAFADFAGIEPGWRVADVGAGTGMLTRELVARLGPASVGAADPSPPFAEALRERFPAVDVHEAPAERLPWADAAFDASLAQLVISFVTDPAATVGELRRVVREGGTVAVCMWDLDGGMEMLAAIARARRAFDDSTGHGVRRWTREELGELLDAGGLRDVETGELVVESSYDHFDEYWSAITPGAGGPAGTWIASLDEAQREAMRAETHRQLGSPDGPFTLRARCYAARGGV